MSNVSKRLASVALKEGEKAYSIGTLLAEKEANSSNPEFTSVLDELMGIGQGKGIAFEFASGEIITFDKFEESAIIVRNAELNGKTYPILSVIADSSIRGNDLEIPLSIFRRVPALMEDRIRLVAEHPLTEKLLRNSMGDLMRLRELSGHRVSIDSAMSLAKTTFKIVNGKNTRVDVAALPENERQTMTFYQVSFC